MTHLATAPGGNGKADPMNITPTNLFALNKALDADNHVREFSPTYASHLRRCVRAGLLESTDEKVGARGRAFKLTAKGVKAINAFRLEGLL